LRGLRSLLALELRELASARSAALLVLLMGPLVAQAFASAAAVYAEASGGGGGPAALAMGLSPLDGFLVPVWGVYDVAAALLLPFAAIRLLAVPRTRGDLRLLMQAPVGTGLQVGAKALALFAVWGLAWLPGLAALLLWRHGGGALHGPEVLTLLLGHALRGLLAIAVSLLAASAARSAASAAILALGFTLGSWVLDLAGAAKGGWIARLAAFTPTAALRSFESGLLDLRAVAILALASLGALACAALLLPPGRRLRTRVLGAGAAAGTTLLLLMACTGIRASRDVSENRRHSFPPAVEAALRGLPGPVRLEVRLAPEDPRAADLRGTLARLDRVLDLQPAWTAASRTGLFEAADPRYGEITLHVGSGSAATRSVAEPILLEALFQAAGRALPDAEAPAYAGHPLPRVPGGMLVFGLLLWPGAVALALLLHHRSRSRP